MQLRDMHVVACVWMCVVVGGGAGMGVGEGARMCVWVGQAKAINVYVSAKPRQSTCAYGLVQSQCRLCNSLQPLAVLGHMAGGLHPVT